MEITQNTKNALFVIETFREFCQKNNHKELHCSSIISHHDPTLRFVNSTTSVMKPYLYDVNSLESGLFMIQPAVGFQGINSWKNNKEISPYTSYFISLGILGSISILPKLIQEMESYLLNWLKFGVKELEAKYYYADNDLASLKNVFNIQTTEDRTGPSPYRHKFGSELLKGRNINIYATLGLNENEIGNITIIEDNHIPVAAEIAFDVPMLVQAKLAYIHTMYSLPATDILRRTFPQYSDLQKLLVLADLITTGINLMLDGLKIGSRGRKGNLKCTIRLAADIISTLGLSSEELYRIVNTIVSEEIIIRNRLNYNPPFSCPERISENYCSKIEELI